MGEVFKVVAMQGELMGNGGIEPSQGKAGGGAVTWRMLYTLDRIDLQPSHLIPIQNITRYIPTTSI